MNQVLSGSMVHRMIVFIAIMMPGGQDVGSVLKERSDATHWALTMYTLHRH